MEKIENQTVAEEKSLVPRMEHQVTEEEPVATETVHQIVAEDNTKQAPVGDSTQSDTERYYEWANDTDPDNYRFEFAGLPFPRVVVEKKKDMSSTKNSNKVVKHKKRRTPEKEEGEAECLMDAMSDKSRLYPDNGMVLDVKPLRSYRQDDMNTDDMNTSHTRDLPEQPKFVTVASVTPRKPRTKKQKIERVTAVAGIEVEAASSPSREVAVASYLANVGTESSSMAMVVAGHGKEECNWNRLPHDVEGKFKCNICNKSFTSHQALGGHKSSHSEKHRKIPGITDTDSDRICVEAGSYTHKCATCGDAFLTGTALGGHKRKHYTPLVAPQVKISTTLSLGSLVTPQKIENSQTNKKNLLDFDLNQPAQMEEDLVQFDSNESYLTKNSQRVQQASELDL